MNLADIQRFAAQGETEQIEFKQSTGALKSAGMTLCGFLNANGGQVFFGVTPQGKIVGQQVNDSTLRNIAAMLDRFEPPAPISIERIKLKPRLEVIVLSAEDTRGTGPFIYDGRPYQRPRMQVVQNLRAHGRGAPRVATRRCAQGRRSTTSLMPQECYQNLLLWRAHNLKRWENEIAPGITLDDLDHEEILRTVRLGIEAGRLPESTGADIGDILDRLHLRKGDQLLNAAVVLFGTQLEQDYPQCQVRLARFKGNDQSEFIDNRQAIGHAFELLEESMAFMMRHLPIAGRFERGRLERIDEPLFPVAALREAVINAICHRTYAHVGGAISIAVYDDRLEIWSDGGLPFNLKPEDLVRKHDSVPRNPLIARAFYRRGLVEQWGLGIEKIIGLCVEAGHPEPEFGEQAGSVWVRFLPKALVPSRSVADNLTDRQREILAILTDTPGLSVREILSRMTHTLSDRTLRRDLVHLKHLGIVDIGGQGRGTYWHLRSDE